MGTRGAAPRPLGKWRTTVTTLKTLRGGYDAIVVGARCAGAATAMLLARAGLDVLVVDRGRPGADALSTHALMRGGVLQLRRWGLLGALEDTGTPPIRAATFHYAGDQVAVPIKARDGVDALYAPRRTVLDPLLVQAAEASGARVVHGVTALDLVRDACGRVGGAVLSGPDGARSVAKAPIVIGADGMRSRIAALAGAEIERAGRHASAVVYAHWEGLAVEGYHWYYRPGASAGAIPTNGGRTCLFVALPPGRYRGELPLGVGALYRRVLDEVAPEMAAAVTGARLERKLWTFPGAPGFLRRAWGPGWALVGDAGYFKDPLTAHGITDALRDAELLSRAVAAGTEDALAAYQAARDEASLGLFEVTDRVASFEWDLDQAKRDHQALARHMAAESEMLLALDRRALAAA
jgi:flavin-dependent dehydrogenase